MSHTELTSPPSSEALRYTTVDSPIGELLLLGDDRRLRGLYMQDGRKPARVAVDWEPDASAFTDTIAQLDEYFDGRRTTFELSLDMRGSPFEQRVWRALQDIPYGKTASYGEVAQRVGQPSAARAVGLANGRNPIAVIVPCHRVIGANGTLTGYGGGLERKQLLLELEQGQLCMAIPADMGEPPRTPSGAARHMGEPPRTPLRGGTAYGRTAEDAPPGRHG
jgi:methylated-DNA-[protein]-cysteine S-methyltransferase